MVAATQTQAETVSTGNTPKPSKIKLIRDYFGATMDDIKALTQLDRDQLGSGIARAMGLSQESVDFPLISY